MTENKIHNEAVKKYFTKLQTDIINAVEIVDGKNFLVDSWQRSEGGGGTTCILENGSVFFCTINCCNVVSNFFERCLES